MCQEEAKNVRSASSSSNGYRSNILLVRRRIISREIMHQRDSASAVEEILRDRRVCDKVEYSAVISRDVATIEVRQQVDGSVIVHSVGVQDTRNQDSIGWLNTVSLVLRMVDYLARTSVYFPMTAVLTNSVRRVY